MTKREREITDRKQIEQILNDSKVLHLALVDNGLPYVLPMNYGYEFKNDKLVIYLHSGLRGYKLDVMKNSPTCAFEMECGILPFEGEVPCKYGVEYFCLMGRGEIEFVDDPQEKVHSLKLLMQTQTGKNFDFSERIASIVSVMKINVSEYFAKYRPAPKPVDREI